MADEMTVAATTHTLRRSKFRAMCMMLQSSIAPKFKLNQSSDFGSVLIDGLYNAAFKIYPAGHEKISSWPRGRQRDVVLSLQLSVERDPTGGAVSSTHWITIAILGVDAGDQLLGISKAERSLEEVIECGHLFGIGKPDKVCTLKTIKVEISIMTDKTPRKSEVPTKHWQQRLKMYENSKKYGDITLRIIGCQGQEQEPPKKRRKIDSVESVGIGESQDITFKTSSIALRSASSVFESMMSSNMKEKVEGIIEIHAAKAKDVDDMLYYIIVQDLRQDVDPLSLIKLAHLYQLTDLFNACAARMVQYSYLKIEDFIEIARTFERYEIKDGYDHLIQFGRDEIEEIKHLDGFKDLPFSLKYGLLESKMIKENLLPDFFD